MAIETEIDYSSIENYFLWIDRFAGGFRSVMIDRLGKVTSHKFEGKQGLEQCKRNFAVWEDTIQENNLLDVNTFKYPAWILEQNLRDNVFALILSSVIILFCPILLVRPSGSEGILLFLMCILSIVLLDIQMICSLIGRKRKFARITIEGDTLKVARLDGKVRWYAVDEIRKYKVSRSMNKSSSIYFNDGYVLRNIERVNHWPLLREYLLDKLEF